jgi:hypothetical protein
MSKKSAKTKPGRFLVYTYARKNAQLGNRARAKHLARFHDRQAATKFAAAESIALEGTVYVDEILGRNKGEPIATYVSGMSMRI